VAGGVGVVENLNVGGDLKVDTSVLVVNSTTNRVGINKAVPAYTLDVDGDINFTGTFREDGNPFISTPWTIETSPDALNYTDGNVGIGAADPAAKLHVTGNAHITTTLNVGGVVTLTDTTEATSSTTGALKAAGWCRYCEGCVCRGTCLCHGGSHHQYGWGDKEDILLYGSAH